LVGAFVGAVVGALLVLLVGAFVGLLVGATVSAPDTAPVPVLAEVTPPMGTADAALDTMAVVGADADALFAGDALMGA
jgi:hypothetical protein